MDQRIKKITINTKILMESIVVFFVLYFSSSLYFINLKGTYQLIIFLCFALSVVLFRLPIVFRSISKSPKSFVLLSILFINATITTFINGENLKNYIIFIVLLLISYLIKSAIKIEDYIKSYVRVMFYIAAISLVFYLFSAVLNVLPNGFNSFLRKGVSFDNYILYTTTTNAKTMTFTRNGSFFWEPGAFQLYLNLAIFFELFVFAKINSKHILVFILAIISTMSTTGYIALFLLLFIYMLNNSKIKMVINKSKIIKIIGLVIVLAIFWHYMPNEWKYYIFGKLFSNDGDMSLTLGRRLKGIDIAFDEFLKNPFWGMGFEKFASYTESGILLTNTPINWIATLGVASSTILNLYYAKLVRLSSKKKNQLILIIFLFILISAQDMFKNPSLLILIIYSMDYTGQKNANI